MVCHLLPFFCSQPSATAISMLTIGDSSRSPVDSSMAHAMQVRGATLTVFFTSCFVSLPPVAFFTHFVSVYSTSTGEPTGLRSKRSGEYRPHELMAAIMNWEGQE